MITNVTIKSIPSPLFTSHNSIIKVINQVELILNLRNVTKKCNHEQRIQKYKFKDLKFYFWLARTYIIFFIVVFIYFMVLVDGIGAGQVSEVDIVALDVVGVLLKDHAGGNFLTSSAAVGFVA